MTSVEWVSEISLRDSDHIVLEGMSLTVTASISREALETILENARALHPREAILLLRGKMVEGEVVISEILIPPIATYGKGFASFPTHMMPLDFSIIGTAHSHPSGNPTPSIHDLNRSFGRVMMIVAFPYLMKENVAVYDRTGRRLMLKIHYDNE